MKVIHIINNIGGGSGTFLRNIQKKGEIVWEISKQKQLPIKLNEIKAIVMYGYIEHFDFKPFKNKKKIYYFHGLRAISRRMLFNKFEFNPIHLYKFYKFKNWLKNFDCFISASFSLSNLVKKFYNVDSFVIYNGLDFKSMPEIKRERNDKVLLWIGRSAWIKGLDNFLKLMELLPEYEGWILGVENKNYKNIKFFGYQKDVYNYISKAKAVVITSYYEAFSYVTLESLYYGVPVLSLKSAGGVFEILQILNKYEWIFDDIYQMAEFIKNNEIEDYKIDYLFNELFDFERNYLRLKKIIEML